jgi:HD-like signal output (HDOD) protein
MVDLIARDAVHVPPYPAVAIRLRELVRKENYGIREVVALVSADPALAAEVIHCSNSAYYGRGDITSLQPAITRVGTTEVVRLALASGLAATARVPGPLLQIKRRAWQDSVASALICQMLARQRGLASDDAFLCGLLHDFGWLLALRGLEEILQKHPEVPARDAAAWAEVVENLHVELGLVLAARWDLPALLNDVISLHHENDPGKSPHAAMIDVVQAADQVVALLGRHAHITAETLNAAPKLRAEERARLVASLPGIPSVIAAFEVDQPGKPAVSKVAAAPAPADPVPAEELVPIEGTVTLHSPKRPNPFALRAVGTASWEMFGKDPIPEGLLIEATLGSADPPLRIWAKSVQSRSESGGFRVVCKPFLLNGQVLAKWLQLRGAGATEAAAKKAAS